MRFDIELRIRMDGVNLVLFDSFELRSNPRSLKLRL